MPALTHDRDGQPRDMATSTETTATATYENATQSSEAAESWSTHDLTFFIINNIFILMIVTGNTTTIILMIRYKSLRTATNSFAMSLAAADLTMGLAYALYNVINYTLVGKRVLIPLYYPCAISLYFIVVSAGCSLLSLTCIAIDRYIAVLHPLAYPMKMSERTVRAMILSVWAYFTLAVLSVFAVFDTEHLHQEDLECSLLSNIPAWYYLGLILPHAIITNVASKSLYFRILYEAWKAESKIQREQLVFKINRNHRKEAKAGKMMLQISTLFVLCWAPYFIVHIYLYIIGPDAGEGWYTALEITRLFSLANSYMNPVVYFWKNPDFRSALGACLRCQGSSRSNVVSITSAMDPVSTISNATS